MTTYSDMLIYCEPCNKAIEFYDGPDGVMTSTNNFVEGNIDAWNENHSRKFPETCDDCGGKLSRSFDRRKFYELVPRTRILRVLLLASGINPTDSNSYTWGAIISAAEPSLWKKIIGDEDLSKEEIQRLKKLIQDILGKANQADMDSHNSPP